MVDPDVALDCIVRLPLPFSRGLVRFGLVAEGQLPQTAVQRTGVVYDDLCPDVLAVPVPLGEHRPDILLLHIVLRDIAGLMGHNDRLTLIAFQAGRIKDLFRQAQFPADASVPVFVFKDTGGCHDGMVYEISF